jgi:tripartite ATP-independent transporter DctM subunit
VRITLRAVPALLVPVFLVGGIVGGLATPTEISSTAVIYALLIGMFGYKAVDLNGVWRLIGKSAVQASTVLFIIAAASAFSWTLTIATIPHQIVAMFQYLGNSSFLFMVATVFTLVIMGAILEGLPALLVFGPLLLPLAPHFGVNPLQYGIVLIIAMGLGSFMPPIGVCIYVCCSVMGTSMEETSRRMVPYIVVLVGGVLAVAFIPWFSLVLPRLLHLL